MRISITHDVGKDIADECSRITGLEASIDPDGKGEILVGFRNLKASENTVLIQTISAGVNQLDFTSLSDKVTVCSNAGAYSNIVAELAFGLLLSHMKKIGQFDAETKAGKFDRKQTPMLAGKTLGILGYGGIGSQMARVAKAFDMKTIGYSRTRRNGEYLDSWSETPEELFSSSDVILLAIPLSEKTRGIVNENLLSGFSGSYLINIARSDIVNKDDMLKFLRNNPEKYYLTDVWWGEPEIKDPVPVNALLTPHIGGYSPDMMRIATIKACENVKRFLEGNPENVVNGKEYMDES